VQYFKQLPVEHQTVQILITHRKGAENCEIGKGEVIEKNEHEML
jgi:hypothetical protein